jgi:hypothetical protein
MEQPEPIKPNTPVILCVDHPAYKHCTGVFIADIANNLGRGRVRLNHRNGMVVSVKKTDLLDCTTPQAVAYMMDLLGAMTSAVQNLAAITVNMERCVPKDPRRAAERARIIDRFTDDNAVLNMARLLDLAKFDIDTTVLADTEDATEDIEISDACTICMVVRKTHACVPCGHMVSCPTCTPKVERTHCCPICRAEVREMVPIFR